VTGSGGKQLKHNIRTLSNGKGLRIVKAYLWTNWGSRKNRKEHGGGNESEANPQLKRKRKVFVEKKPLSTTLRVHGRVPRKSADKDRKKARGDSGAESHEDAQVIGGEPCKVGVL